MPRKLFIVAMVVIAAHVAQEISIGATPVGSFIANSVQIFASVLAAVACIGASRRGSGSSRQFWILISCSCVIWTLGNCLFLYYESFVKIVPPNGSMAYFFVDTRSFFLILALLLELKDESSLVDMAAFLDLVQLAIIFTLIYLAWYYVPVVGGSILSHIKRSSEIEIGENLSVIALGLVQATRARTPQIHRLYLTLISISGILATGSVLEAYISLKAGRVPPTGTWLDLFWTATFLGLVLWAIGWQPRAGFYPAVARSKRFASMLFDNTLSALAPLIVLLQAVELGQGWRRLSFSLLGISILCFAARLSLSEFREFRSTVKAGKANLERLEAESKFRVAFHANPESITITTLEEGSYLEVNDAFVAAIGYQRSELIGRTSLELNVWVDRRDRSKFVDKLRRGEQVNNWEIRFRTKSGKEQQIVLSAHLIQLQGQVCILSILRDVTEQRMLEQRLLRAQRMEAVGRLAGGVAHDFNNLLMITSANVELLEKASHDPERVQRYARQIQAATDRGALLTQQLLAFSRQQILSPSVVNLNIVITDLWKMLPRLLGEDVETILSLEPTLGCVTADRGQMEQVLMNLAVNARDAMPQGGRLTIETANVEVGNNFVTTGSAEGPSGCCVLLTVTDTGCGMNPAVMEHIFDPFFTTKELGKGTGLGLATVYGIVKQSGGWISVYSEIEKGSTFKIYLPRVQQTPAEAELAPSADPAPAGSGTILLVEDETGLRQATSEYLRGKGYQVLEADTGEAALEICKSYPGRIDLLITDIVMPGSSGPMVAKQVAEMRSGICTILMSGYPDRTLDPDLLGQNAVFFQKPFNLDALARKIHAMLDRKG